MHDGLSWRDAAARLGIQTSRTTAQRLYRRWQHDGDRILDDRRHGHPSKLHEPMRQWLVAFCHQTPETPGRVLQAELQARFGVTLSVGYLNRVRAALGVRYVRPPKKPT
jgi:transposase